MDPTVKKLIEEAVSVIQYLSLQIVVAWSHGYMPQTKQTKINHGSYFSHILSV